MGFCLGVLIYVYVYQIYDVTPVQTQLRAHGYETQALQQEPETQKKLAKPNGFDRMTAGSSSTARPDVGCPQISGKLGGMGPFFLWDSCSREIISLQTFATGSPLRSWVACPTR